MSDKKAEGKEYTLIPETFFAEDPALHPEGLAAGLGKYLLSQGELQKLDVRAMIHLLRSLDVKGFSKLPGTLMMAELDTFDHTPNDVVNAIADRLQVQSDIITYLYHRLEGTNAPVDRTEDVSGYLDESFKEKSPLAQKFEEVVSKRKDNE